MYMFSLYYIEISTNHVHAQEGSSQRSAQKASGAVILDPEKFPAKTRVIWNNNFEYGPILKYSLQSL